MLCGSGALQNNVGPNVKVKNLNRRYCGTSNCIDLIGLFKCVLYGHMLIPILSVY